MANSKEPETPLLSTGEHKDADQEKWREKLYRKTGFSSKTLWDWMKLLLIPLLLAGGGIWFNQQQAKRDNQIADNRRHDDILKAYLDNISDLTLKYNLHNSGPNDDVRNVARGQTLVAIQRLEGDSQRQAKILQFLHELKLISNDKPVILMYEAWLDGIDMSATRSDLDHDDLSALALNRANLSGVNMDGTNLSCSGLGNANLSGAYLGNADLQGARLEQADLSNADLTSANLSGANLTQYLCGSGVAYDAQGDTSLNGANLTGASLTSANLTGASLTGANLHSADLTGASLTGANLHSADLTGANLHGAKYNTKVIQVRAIAGKLAVIGPTQWPQGFDPKAAGAICVNC